MPDIKNKAVTLSFDDGVTQDIRFIEILNKYNIKSTFNLNSGMLGAEFELEVKGKRVNHANIALEDVRRVYDGHEVAGHTVTHPFLPDLKEEEIITQVENDRIALSEIVGYEVTGFAYPGGGVNFNRRVADVIRDHTGIQYARTTKNTFGFEKQTDLYVFEPTARPTADFDEFFRITEKFLTLESSSPALFYVWGHTYEFDADNSWDRFEEWCRLISSDKSIFFGTNKEVFERLR